MKERDFDTALFQAAKVFVEAYSEELKAIPVSNIRISKEDFKRNRRKDFKKNKKLILYKEKGPK